MVAQASTNPRCLGPRPKRASRTSISPSRQPAPPPQLPRAPLPSDTRWEWGGRRTAARASRAPKCVWCRRTEVEMRTRKSLQRPIHIGRIPGRAEPSRTLEARRARRRVICRSNSVWLPRHSRFPRINLRRHREWPPWNLLRTRCRPQVVCGLLYIETRCRQRTKWTKMPARQSRICRPSRRRQTRPGPLNRGGGRRLLKRIASPRCPRPQPRRS